jgi:hypothetical protein
MEKRMLLLNLFAIRGVEKKEAVGLFWAPNLETLWWMVDAVTDPEVCEYFVIDAPAAITWPGDAPAIGVEREEEEDEDEDEISQTLSCGASFEFALADVLYAEIKEGWIQMPSAPESLEETPLILKEWGRWGWGRH